MAKDEYVRVDCDVGEERGNALYITQDDGPRTKWAYLPLSQISEIHREDGWIMVKRWLAEKENLI